MQNTLVRPVSITRITGHQAKIDGDLLATEEPLEIRLGFGPDLDRQQKRISVTMRTPGHDFELALGFLFTEGIIHNMDEIRQIKYCTELNSIENKENIVRIEIDPKVELDMTKFNRNFYTTSSCGVCGKESIEAVMSQCNFKSAQNNFTISPELLINLPDQLRVQQSVFEFTGGIHASALFDTHGKLVLLREDIGRHNALDKIIGASFGAPLFSNKLALTFPLSEYILLLSGRASFEQIQKAAMAGITMICSVGAPSSLAVETAEKFGMTLIGFLRDQRFNIYTNPNRVSIPGEN